MSQTKSHEQAGLVIVQPAMEPWPRGLRKIGSVAVFFYVRWSTIGIGIEVLSGGAAVVIGPLMFGAVNIRRQVAAGEAANPEQPS